MKTENLIKTHSSRFKIDYIMLFCVLSLTVIGIVFSYSASSYSSERTYGTPFHFVIKQALGATMGIVVCFLMLFIKIDWLKKLSLPLLGISFVLLILVFVNGIGVEVYGAKRWIGFGSFTFQPSELAKFSFVIFSAMYLSSNKVNSKSFFASLPVIAVGLGFCALIILEPNMSITMCMALIMMGLLFVSGLGSKPFIILIALVACAVPVLIFMEPYRLQRLLAFLDPWASPKGEGYQLIQSLYALGSGGWFGVGLFNSRQKYLFLPFAESDFIFSIIGEEIGFIGVLFVLLIFVVLIYRGIRLAINCKNAYHSILVSGFTLVIAIQTLINIAVVTGSIPPTGLPLPFVSAGSSSLVLFFASVGIMLNISAQTEIVSPHLLLAKKIKAPRVRGARS